MNTKILGLLVFCLARCYNAAKIWPTRLYAPWKTNFGCRYEVNMHGEKYVLQATEKCIQMNSWCYHTLQGVYDNCQPINRYMYIQTAGGLRLQWSLDKNLSGGWEHRLGVVDYFDMCKDDYTPRKIMGGNQWMQSDYRQVGTITRLGGEVCTEVTTTTTATTTTATPTGPPSTTNTTTNTTTPTIYNPTTNTTTDTTTNTTTNTTTPIIYNTITITTTEPPSTTDTTTNTTTDTTTNTTTNTSTPTTEPPSTTDTTTNTTTDTTTNTTTNTSTPTIDITTTPPIIMPPTIRIPHLHLLSTDTRTTMPTTDVLNCSACIGDGYEDNTCTKVDDGPLTCTCSANYKNDDTDTSKCVKDCTACDASVTGYEGTCDVSPTAITCTCTEGYKPSSTDTKLCVGMSSRI